MARLNEPVMSTDSLETLRRKFLRQNREIARINSNQSQRIRELENDCARMLSENLELRSHILQLENELESNNANRIADHALEVKAKLEAQLSIFSSLLEGLGTEPPRKRHTPSVRRVSKPKSSPNFASPARRLRNVARDAEAMALQAARLPAIPEYKPFPREPRATLNDEIRALRGDAEETTNSPDLGPPPVSRFVEDDPVKVDSPSTKSLPVEMNNTEKSAITETVTPAPKLDLTKTTSSNRVAKDQSEQSAPIRIDRPKNSAPPAPAPAPAPTPHPLRAGTKRKFGTEENDSFRILKQADKQNENGIVAKPRPLQDLSKRKSVKDPSANKREPREKVSGREVSLPNPRMALAAKSTNESPRKVDKVGKPANSEDSKPSNKPRSTPATDKPVSKPPKKALPVLQIPPPEAVAELPAPPVAISIPEPPSTPTPDDEDEDAPLTTGPNTPSAPHEPPTTRDTPPPGMCLDGDSSSSSAARPSRRSRPAISYAEPNLRDKMRRPTKELFDAVAGEGKFRARHSIAAAPPQPQSQPGTARKQPPGDENARPGSGASAVRPVVSEAETRSHGKPEEGEEEGMTVAERAVAREAARRASVRSPTPGACVQVTAGDVSAAVAVQRKRRGSAMAPLAAERKGSSSAGEKAEDQETGPQPAAGGDAGDVYDFNSSSPAAENKGKEQAVRNGGAAAPAESVTGRSQARRSRASTAAVAAPVQVDGAAGLVGPDAAAATGLRNGGKGAGSRKRASMAAAMTKMSMLEQDDADESAGEGDWPPAAAKDRIARRRSMML